MARAAKMEPVGSPVRVWSVDVLRSRLSVAPLEPVAARPGLAAWAAAFAVLGAAVAVDPAGLRPFTSLRWAVVGTALALAGFAAARPSPGPTPPRHRPLPRSFVAAGAVVVGSTVVAAAVVGEPVTAWLGHPQRHLGVLAWFVFAAAAIAGAALVDDAAGRLLLCRACWAAGLATGAVVAAEVAGWEPLGASFADGRAGGLLGQPTALGALAVLLLPLAMVGAPGRRVRWVAAAALVLAILASQSRGALLGLLAVAVVSLPAVLPRVRAVHVLWAPAAVLVVAVTPVGDRVLAAGDSGRLDEWALAVDVLADHPLLGAGPEGYRLEVPGALDEGYVSRHGREVVIDRAHAAPLDVALSGGVAAGVAYVVAVGAVVLATWRLQRRTPWSVPAAAGAGATGALVAGVVAFPTTEVDGVAWLLAGLAVAAAAPVRPAAATAAVRGPGMAAAAALILTCVFAGATDVIADRQLGRAADLSAAGRHQEALAAADRALAVRPDLVDGWYVAGRVAAAGPTILDLDEAIARAESGRRRSPGDPALRSLHAALVVERAARTRLGGDVRAAERTVAAAQAADPTDPALDELRQVLRRLDGTPPYGLGCIGRCDTGP